MSISLGNLAMLSKEYMNNTKFVMLLNQMRLVKIPNHNEYKSASDPKAKNTKRTSCETEMVIWSTPIIHMVYTRAIRMRNIMAKLIHQKLTANCESIGLTKIPSSSTTWITRESLPILM